MLELVIPRLFFDDLSQQEGQEFFVILSSGEVFTEGLFLRCVGSVSGVLWSSSNGRDRSTYTFKLLLDTQFLRADERPDDDLNGQIDILPRHVFPQMHLRACLRHPDDTLEMPDRDGIGSSRH